jgi:hypothetical protein
MAPHHTGAVGLDPYREERRSAGDYVLVVLTLIVIAGMVAWAFLG